MRSISPQSWRRNAKPTRGVLVDFNALPRRRQRPAGVVETLASVVMLGLASLANAAPDFYLGPGDDPDGDLAFQAALTDPLYEEDFELYPTGARYPDIPYESAPDGYVYPMDSVDLAGIPIGTGIKSSQG